MRAAYYRPGTNWAKRDAAVITAVRVTAFVAQLIVLHRRPQKSDRQGQLRCHYVSYRTDNAAHGC